MTPNKCKCNWIPSVFHIIDPMWGQTVYHQVICEHCHRRGKKMPTRKEAIKEWNVNGPDGSGVMKDLIDCNDCLHLSMTEKAQNELCAAGHDKSMIPHYCTKYNRRVFHKPYDEPMLHPCDECTKEMENKQC